MQPTVKISGLPKVVTPALTAKVPVVNGTETDYSLLSDLITVFFNNIPSGVVPGLTADYVISGGVWTADSVAVNRNASMTAITVYLGQRSITIGAVTARTFTPSKDTYIDILNNLDGTGTLVYTEVTNNAASPALAANSIRIGIIVTGATTIAATGSINQGQEDRVLPIASSIPYIVNDSLGNPICLRDPNQRLLGYSRITVAFTTTTVGSYVDVTGLQTTFKMPATLRKCKVRFSPQVKTSAAAPATMQAAVRESSTVLATATINEPTAGYNEHEGAEQLFTPPSGVHTYKASVAQNGAAGTLTVQAGTTGPIDGYMALELFVEQW